METFRRWKEIRILSVDLNITNILKIGFGSKCILIVTNIELPLKVLFSYLIIQKTIKYYSPLFQIGQIFPVPTLTVQCRPSCPSSKRQIRWIRFRISDSGSQNIVLKNYSKVKKSLILQHCETFFIFSKCAFEFHWLEGCVIFKIFAKCRERIQRKQQKVCEKKILLNWLWQVKMNLTLPAGSLCWQGTVTLEVYATPMQVKV